jgi:MoaA/NifB/PqqE/SkfB family radical SAM enzyme
MKAAVEAGLDQIWISVDSFDQIVANHMRQGTLVDKLRAKIADGIKAGIPIHISTVASHANVRVLGKTLEDLCSLGNPPIHIQEFQDFGEPSGILEVNERSMLVESVERIRIKYPDSKIYLPAFMTRNNEICSAPWLRPAITVEGFLTPCCTSFDPTHYDFANIFIDDYESLWLTDGVQSWLRKMYADEVSMCNGCGLNPRKSGIEQRLEKSGKSGREIHMMKVE